LSNNLLGKLRSIKYQGWQFIVTLDEPRFYLTTDDQRIWLRPGQEPPEMPKNTIQDRTMMVTIAWNPFGFHVLWAPLKDKTFDAEYYRDDILTALVSFRPEGAGGNLLFMQAIQLRSVSPFVPTTGWDSPQTRHTCLISHRQASLYSGMSYAVCRRWLLHHTK
jgi:hypothetical protein